MSKRTFSTLPHLAGKAPHEPVRVLMVCMGNICRSPTAHGVLARMAAGAARVVAVDSAGTHGYHVGEPPDARAQAHAARRGYDLSAQRARHLRVQDFAAFDLVLVMDEANEAAASALCPPAERHRLRRLTDFCRTHAASEVPDPYYGGAQGFEQVLDLVEDACAGLLDCIAQASMGKAAAH
ncbi:low molecular weight protein-tyrosine-phosphatase [Alicycliphilus sp. T452]